MIGHGLQSLIRDGFTINSGHMRHFVSHYEVDGGLIFRLIGHSPEGVPQAVEPQTLSPIDVETL
jgi:hypothetical protein